ncbi:MAG TPA: radical SAM protein [Bacteroidales bacterium]|nr:radical SAM protein [Bacteroidales bacterium]
MCPRNCGVDRFSDKLGYCKADAAFHIASICIHKGEEPVISGSKGICNIFFPHCNLQCIYCQNHDISGNALHIDSWEMSFDQVIEKVCETLEQTENIVGFVSPSHYIPQVMAIIRGIKAKGKAPVFVYNTNGYDSVESLKMLEGLIDVYLPDFKYMDKHIAFRYSGARNYPEMASAALREMYRQKGSTLILDDYHIAQSGIILRHLVLPYATEQSIEVLRFIAEEISTKFHISLMSQYYPTACVQNHNELGRSLLKEEYEKVVNAFHEFGFYRGWVQDLGSQTVYRPDFSKAKPFDL